MVKHVTEVDSAFMNRLDSTLQKIEGALQNIKVLEKPEYLTSEEFMGKIKVSRWKLDILISQGILRHKKIGRKLYIPSTEVDRYFAGEMNLE